jgi:hypothetical protein
VLLNARRWVSMLAGCAIRMEIELQVQRVHASYLSSIHPRFAAGLIITVVSALASSF